jgi:hypothetical protein
MVRVFSIYVPNKACAVYCTRYKHLTIIRWTRGDYQGILYLKFKLSNEKTAFVPRDVIFYGISLKFMISQSSVGYYNIPRQIHSGIL